jgi:hypothetical protein
LSYKIILQFGLILMLFLFSMGVSWYEGSELADNSLEWKYSTPFTQLFHRGFVNKGDLSQLDYFVYATKFKPTYPLLMLFSGLYLITLFVYILFKQNHKGFTFFLFAAGLILSIFSLITNKSPTNGVHVISTFSLSIGLLYVVASVVLYFWIITPNSL